mgnify:FL=1
MKKKRKSEGSRICPENINLKGAYERMTVEILMQYFARYGAVAIFVIVLLEYLNLPGFPAGVIMPMAGIWAAKGNIHFIPALMITVAAGLTGSLILYWLGYKGGELFLEKYLNKFPKQRLMIERRLAWVREKGSVGIFLSKLIPMIRTLISIPAGVSKMNLITYTVSSTLGICVWNLFFVGAGYFLGDAVLGYFG